MLAALSALIEKLLRRAKTVLLLFRFRQTLKIHYNGYFSLISLILRNLNSLGLLRTVGQLVSLTGRLVRDDNEFYLKWIRISEDKASSFSNTQTSDSHQFTILSVITTQNYLHWKRTVDSIISQTHNRTKLVLVVSSDVPKDVLASVNQMKHEYHWMKIIINCGDQLSCCWNAALSEISTESGYVILLDTGDILAHTALHYVSEMLESAKIQYLYADHDHINEHGERSKPFFKPDFSPDLIYDPDYISPMAIVSKSLIKQTGKFNPEYGEATVYEYILRLVSNTGQIQHLPKILCHRCSFERKNSDNFDKAYNDFMKVKYKEFLTISPSQNSRYPELYPQYPLAVKNILVSIIIPTKDGLEILTSCVDSILSQQTSLQYEIVILNNNSENPETYKWFDDISRKQSNITILEASYPFNWSKLNNQGISAASGNVYIFLNNDTTVITPDWIERLTSLALHKDTGLAYPLLLYPDDTIQHAGVVVGFGGYADHLYQGTITDDSNCCFVSPLKRRNVLTGTGACLTASKSTIDKIGNFDESFDVVGSDVELGIRAYERGLINIYDPYVRLYHHESKTRIPGNSAKDLSVCKLFYQYYLSNGDPYYNPNLSLKCKYPMFNGI